MILYEVLRLYTPVGALSRMTKQEVELGNLCLPAGIIVNMPFALVHQDPQLWGEDALEFKPERFAEGIVKATGGNNAFFSFAFTESSKAAQGGLESRCSLKRLLVYTINERLRTLLFCNSSHCATQNAMSNLSIGSAGRSRNLSRQNHGWRLGEKFARNTIGMERNPAFSSSSS
ncbi:hypothetical protein V2J09_006240 [Rumex salicifolius]